MQEVVAHPGKTGFARLATATGAILYDPSRLNQPSELEFDPEALAAAGRTTGSAHGRGTAWFVSAPNQASETWVLRHYRRGGWAAIAGDWYAWTGEPRSRAFRELSLLARLHELGLPVPRPVAARVRRWGPAYRADLLTVAVPGATSLAARAAESMPDKLMSAVGACIRRFHDAGVWHADLNAHNVLIDRAGAIYLIDFDRARVRPPGGWAERNLARLHRSLTKIARARDMALDPALWQALLAGYAI
jgi:3-deoxy-D-manno-octulosonic acid kinase